MQDLLLWVLLIIALLIGAYLDLQYAHAGYPPGWRWKAVLFSVGGFVSGLGGYLVIGRIENQSIPPLLLLGIVIFGGIISAWLIPVRMRYVIPRKRNLDT